MKHFVLCLLVHQIFAQDLPCPISLSINISDGAVVDGGFLKDNVTYHEGEYFNLNGTTYGCICKRRKCIRKCCRLNKKLVNNRKCVKTSESTFHGISIYDGSDVSASTKLNDFHIIVGRRCQYDDSFRYKPDNSSDIKLQSDGSLFIESEGVSFDLENYCVDVFDSEISAFLCEQLDDERWLVYGMIVSMPFLLATFLVYAVLPESNLHRRALMSYVSTLLLGYILLSSVQLSSGNIPNLGCQLLGYSILFCFIVSFFWMNVMCIDMWLTFRGIRGYGGRKKAERKRFIIYSIYAWGMPFLHILIVFLLNTYVDETSSFHPALGTERCFVGTGLPNFLYFYCQAMIVIIINIILFILTGIKIYQVKRDTSMLKHSDNNKHSYEEDKQQFKLYVKLLFAMGINWTMEIISWACVYFWQEVKAVFYFTDFVNAMYGVFIFFIFVFKRKIWKSLKKRYYIQIGKPHLAHALSTTRNRTSNFSTTDTGVNMTEMRNGKEEERALNNMI